MYNYFLTNITVWAHFSPISINAVNKPFRHVITVNTVLGALLSVTEDIKMFQRSLADGNRWSDVEEAIVKAIFGKQVDWNVAPCLLQSQSPWCRTNWITQPIPKPDQIFEPSSPKYDIMAARMRRRRSDCLRAATLAPTVASRMSDGLNYLGSPCTWKKNRHPSPKST